VPALESARQVSTVLVLTMLLSLVEVSICNAFF
jgi:hypothetical protein